MTQKASQLANPICPRTLSELGVDVTSLTGRLLGSEPIHASPAFARLGYLVAGRSPAYAKATARQAIHFFDSSPLFPF